MPSGPWRHDPLPTILNHTRQVGLFNLSRRMQVLLSTVSVHLLGKSNQRPARCAKKSKELQQGEGNERLHYVVARGCRKGQTHQPLRRSQVTSNGVSLLVNWVIFDVTRRCPVAQRPNHLASGGLAPGTSHNTLKINSLRSYDHSATPCLRWRSGGPTRRPKKRALPVCANCLAKIVSNPQIR